MCDAAATNYVLGAPSINSTDRCHPIFTYTTKYGCPAFSATAIIRYLSAHPTLIGLLLIGFGVLSTFWGKSLFDYTVGLLSGGVVFMLSLLAMSMFEMLEYLTEEDNDEELYLTIIAFVVSLLLGFLVGYFMYRSGSYFGVITIGTIAGFFLGMQLYNLLFFETHKLWVLIVIVITSISVCAYASARYSKKIMYFGTSFIGAYSLVRGVSLFLGHFPVNEALLYSELSRDITH